LELPFSAFAAVFSKTVLWTTARRKQLKEWIFVTQDVSTTRFEPPAPATDGGDSTKDVAREQAAGVAGSAKDAGQHVAGVARDEVGNVASEATRQAKDVAAQARDELSRQASDQQQRVAGGLRSLGTELGSMAERSEQPGVATDLARQASAKAHEVARWLEDRDPSSLLDEVSAFARRRPGTFLTMALVAGVAAGRLTRGLKDDSTGGSSPTAAPGDATGAVAPPAPTAAADRPGPATDVAHPYAPVPGDEIVAGDQVVEVAEVVEPQFPGERGYDGDTR
jgi:hypothetical protein